MSNYLTNTLPIDRYNKCFFAETFISTADMVENGATIYGTPAVNLGATLDGSTDSFSYNISGKFIDKDPWSCQCIFVPDFNYDEDTFRVLVYSENNYYAIRKYNNASSNLLQIKLGNVVISNIGTGAYGPYWREGEKNVITVSSTSGATDAWLNEGHILVADSSAWSYIDETTMYVGSRLGGFDHFGGRLIMLKMYNTLLTESDHRHVWGY